MDRRDPGSELSDRAISVIILTGCGDVQQQATGAATAEDEFSPLLADLRKAANWNRVVDRKNVPIAFLKIKG
ncbi:Unknown protein sequence [Pseudomonas syringae pv. maculicola]|nr:Unknown protein sequence [Pseudomonas syringae pv. maculicola]